MNEKSWGIPTPLHMESAKLRNFPVDALPPVLREMAIAIACTTSTDVAIPSKKDHKSQAYFKETKGEIYLEYPPERTV